MKLTTIIDEEYKEIHAQELQKAVQGKYNTAYELVKIFSDTIDSSVFEQERDYPFKYFKKIIPKYVINNTNHNDITAVSCEINNLQEKRHFQYAGSFLSSIIYLHYQKTKSTGEYLIITSHLRRKGNELYGLCTRNEANVRIDGNAGSFVCKKMQGGTVHITGDVLHSLGSEMSSGKIMVEGSVNGDCGYELSGGTIIVEKSVTCNVGECMKNGNIIVKENVGQYTGIGMKNGRIEIYGFVGTIGQYMRGGKIILHQNQEPISKKFISGKIYHKDKCIESTGKKRIRQVKSFFKNMFKVKSES